MCIFLLYSRTSIERPPIKRPVIKVAVSNTLEIKTLLTSHLSFSGRPEKGVFNYPNPDSPKLNTRSLALFWKGDDR